MVGLFHQGNDCGDDRHCLGGDDTRYPFDRFGLGLLNFLQQAQFCFPQVALGGAGAPLALVKAFQHFHDGFAAAVTEGVFNLCIVPLPYSSLPLMRVKMHAPIRIHAVAQV